MIEICPKNNCTGCSACASICAHKAISMKEAEPYGYLFPEIDPNICIDCGLCKKICPANNPPQLNSPIAAYAAVSRCYEDLMSSSSGGASSVFATHIIKNGGVVYGAVEHDYSHFSHQRIDNIHDLKKIKGSKYVHCYTTSCLSLIKDDLQKGLTVLFLGTPCQVAGVKSYLRKPYDNLILVDLCCHGVPSQKFLREDVEDLCERNKKSFRNKGDINKPWDRWGLYVSFRNKGDINKPWDRYHLSLSTENEHEYIIKSPFLKDNYITAFMAGTTFRENCYSCRYAQSQRVSDITIADFWGYKGHQFVKDKGLSLIMPSTPKGISLIESCKNELQLEERSVDEALRGNGQFNHPSKRPPERDAFLAKYPTSRQKAYEIATHDYVSAYKKLILKYKIKTVLKPLIFLIKSINKY